MGIEKLLDNLKEYLDKGSRKKKAHCDRIDAILKQLEAKEKDLEKGLEKEKNAGKRKQLKMELKIIHAQRKKGAKRRDELQKKCV